MRSVLVTALHRLEKSMCSAVVGCTLPDTSPRYQLDGVHWPCSSGQLDAGLAPLLAGSERGGC